MRAGSVSSRGDEMTKKGETETDGGLSLIEMVRRVGNTSDFVLKLLRNRGVLRHLSDLYCLGCWHPKLVSSAPLSANLSTSNDDASASMSEDVSESESESAGQVHEIWCSKSHKKAQGAVVMKKWIKQIRDWEQQLRQQTNEACV